MYGQVRACLKSFNIYKDTRTLCKGFYDIDKIDARTCTGVFEKSKYYRRPYVYGWCPGSFLSWYTFLFEPGKMTSTLLTQIVLILFLSVIFSSF